MLSKKKPVEIKELTKEDRFERGAEHKRMDVVRFHEFCNRGDYDMVADKIKNKKKAPHLLTAKGDMGNTCLHWAAKAGHSQVVQLLLQSKALPNVQNDLEKETPLHLSSWRDHPACARLLVNAKANIFIQNAKGEKPIDIAKSKKIKDILEPKVSAEEMAKRIQIVNEDEDDE